MKDKTIALIGVLAMLLLIYGDFLRYNECKKWKLKYELMCTAAAAGSASCMYIRNNCSEDLIEKSEYIGRMPIKGDTTSKKVWRLSHKCENRIDSLIELAFNIK